MNVNPNMEKIRKIHFVGIGGAGMGGIAEVMINQGYQVSGSDVCQNSVTKHLSALGAKIVLGHSEQNVIDTDLVVQSSAIPQSNPEVIAAKSLNIPVIPRAKMLASLMQTKCGIAISGTHGKTTTTSLVASVLAELDPTFVIGGLLKSVKTNAKLGKGVIFVAEADESDASFLYLKPKMAVITNIDADHLSTYNNDMVELRKSFLEFATSIPEDGLVVICADDEIAYSLRNEIKVPVITYGFHTDADLQVSEFQQCGLKSHFKVHDKKANKQFDIVLNLAGKHNALNALAAIAIATKLQISEAAIKQALENFMGIGRRFQMYGEFPIPSGKVLLIDDYGHHPREIAATLDAIRLVWPSRRAVVAYQPHRYSRTQALMKEFATVLSNFDALLLLDVYSAGEDPIVGADAISLCREITNLGKITPTFVADINELPTAAKSILQDGDILLLQGAGSIGSMAPKFASMEQSELQGEI
jgi:UDP-N-acetylmuramate--alanine ligase